MITLVKKYLEICRYSLQKEKFNDLFLSHPDYPSVFAVTDTLDLLSIENVAIKVPNEQLIELPDSFLAIFNQGLVLVSKTTALISVETEKGEKRSLSYNEFVKDWNGVIITIVPNNVYPKQDFRYSSKWLAYLFPVLVLILLSVLNNGYGLSEFGLLLTSVTGMIISVCIVREKLGFKSVLVSKFCRLGSDISCDSVFTSEKEKINKWMGFSDLSLLFFTVNLLSLLLQPMNGSGVVGLLSLLSLPVVVYSFWIQIFQIKKWCLFCLVLSSLVVVQIVNWVFISESFLNLSYSILFVYLFFAVMIASLWMALKPILESKSTADQNVKELNQFKRKFDVFNFLSKPVPIVDGLYDLEGLRFGNRNSSVHLTLILSPGCNQYNKVFQEAFELVSNSPDKIFLNVLFNINPENYDNPYKGVVESLLAINNSNLFTVDEAMIDWHIRKIGLEAWKNKWMIDMISLKVKHQMQQQYDWCLENKFNHSPVRILNNRLFPDGFDISELKYFLNDFAIKKEDEISNLIASI
jgi:uncharacterized membrane protein